MLSESQAKINLMFFNKETQVSNRAVILKSKHPNTKQSEEILICYSYAEDDGRRFSVLSHGLTWLNYHVLKRVENSLSGKNPAALSVI